MLFGLRGVPPLQDRSIPQIESEHLPSLPDDAARAGCRMERSILPMGGGKGWRNVVSCSKFTALGGKKEKSLWN